MTWTDAVVVLLVLMQLAGMWELIALRRRLTRAEVRLHILGNHMSKLRTDLEVLWISPNHRLPPDIKHLEFRR